MEKWKQIHQLTSLLLVRSAILGPVERMKIIMQTKHMAQYANPRADLPKGGIDLLGKISLNQGLMSFYRGQSPLILMLSLQHMFKFYFYD